MSAVLPLLTVSHTIKTDIQNAVNAGKELTISRDNIQLNDWTGVGYIVRDTMTGAGSYMISSGSAGTDTTQPTSGGALGLLARRIAALAEGKASAKWLTNEDQNLYETDMFFIDNIGNMLLGKGYIPKVEETYSKQKFMAFANNKNNWIFYYSGHGGVYTNANANFIEPLPDGAEVTPSDIHADTHITFLNACNSASYLDFVGAFGINGPGARVFLGWNDEVIWENSSLYGLNWWTNMWQGDSARQAALKLENRFPSISPNLIIQGNPNTKL